MTTAAAPTVTVDHMGVLDAAFLYAEDAVTHLHIGSLARFEGPAPTFEDVAELFAAKLHLLPRYRQRVRMVPGDLARPVWVDDDHFDLRYHLRHTALPPPASEHDLRNLMGRLMSQPLDRTKPLWEAWMVEGFADGSWAIISKVHHCVVDGISGTDLMVRLLDDAPDAVIADPPVPWVPRPAPSTLGLVADAVTGLARKPLEQLRAAGTIVRQRGVLAAGVSSYLEHTHASPPLSIEGSIGPHRSWAGATVALDDVKRIRAALGGTVNDVLLTLATAGLRELLLSRGDDPAEGAVHTLVPVSVRDPSDMSESNQVTAIVASLPVHLHLPHDRLHSICAQMNELKGSHQAETGAALVAALDALTPPMLVSAVLRGATALVRWVPQQRVNTVTTNVPGPRHALYARGRRMTSYLPFVPIAQGMRVGVAMLSYDGTVGFGLTGDWDSVSDLQPMVDGIQAELAALLGEAEPPKPRRPRSARRPRSRSVSAARPPTPELLDAAQGAPHLNRAAGAPRGEVPGVDESVHRPQRHADARRRVMG